MMIMMNHTNNNHQHDQPDLEDDLYVELEDTIDFLIT